MRTKKDLLEAVWHGAVPRVRPKMMTATSTIAGLLPILWSQGTGADVMKRIATPMVGMVSSVIGVLLVYPAIFYLWKGWRLPDAVEKKQASAES